MGGIAVAVRLNASHPRSTRSTASEIPSMRHVSHATAALVRSLRALRGERVRRSRKDWRNDWAWRARPSLKTLLLAPCGSPQAEARCEAYLHYRQTRNPQAARGLQTRTTSA